MLTDDELAALDHLVKFWGIVSNSVIGTGETRGEDLSALASHVHDLQNAVLAQSAAREYPSKFRLLGETFE